MEIPVASDGRVGSALKAVGCWGPAWGLWPGGAGGPCPPCQVSGRLRPLESEPVWGACHCADWALQPQDAVGGREFSPSRGASSGAGESWEVVGRTSGHKVGRQWSRKVLGLSTKEGALLLRNMGWWPVQKGGCLGFRELCKGKDYASQEVWVGRCACGSQHFAAGRSHEGGQN